MNSEKADNLQQCGNAVIYVLIALALFGALTFTLSRSNEQSDGQNLDSEMITFHSAQLRNYASTAKSVADQMQISGTAFAAMDFVLPSEPAFDTAPHHNKYFHPDGGGFTYAGAQFPPFEACGACAYTSQWYISDVTNVEWTQSAATDVIITAVGIPVTICEEINLQITGSTTIPAFDVADPTPEKTFAEDAGGSNLTTAECSACDGYPTLCVSNNAVDRYYFYTIIAQR